MSTPFLMVQQIPLLLKSFYISTNTQFFFLMFKEQIRKDGKGQLQ